MQKPGARPSMPGARDLPPATQNVRANWVRETTLGNFWGCIVREECLHAIRCEGLANRLMDRLINFDRRLLEKRMAAWNDDRIGKIVAVRNCSTASPAPDDFPIAGFGSDLSVAPEIAERNRGPAPLIKTQNRCGCSNEESFVDRHVESSGLRIDVVEKNVKR